MVSNEDIYKTDEEYKGGIKYITYYVNRPIRPGDPYGGSRGTHENGVDRTTEIENYVYLINNESYENKGRDIRRTQRLL